MEKVNLYKLKYRIVYCSGKLFLTHFVRGGPRVPRQ